MKKPTALATLFTLVIIAATATPLPSPGVNWDPVYRFDKANTFVMEFYAKANELMKTKKLTTHYQSNGNDFDVVAEAGSPGTGMETIIDKKNETAIQIMGTGGGATPMYNAGGYKMPAAEDLKRLELTATSETKSILGYECKRYTYTYKKIFGEVWMTDKVSLSNDVGVFRACKMAALHNTLSVEGFVMEMTTEDAKGGKTLMKTIGLQLEDKYSVDLKGASMSTAMNKINYFTF
jgi:hypothetical protein